MVKRQGGGHFELYLFIITIIIIILYSIDVV